MRYPARILPMALATAWLALSAASCANNSRSSASTSSSEAPPAARLEERAWTPAATGDEIAAWASAGCPGQGQPRLQCLEKALISVIQPAGVDRA
ncbi:MAG TPA: hypothetical protein VFQ39_13895, partial [Longimicrobium sp.]|nr:hypothetical protein [Longimicrobium sp.]